MVKIILASHHQLADGMKDTLDYILPEHVTVEALSAYMANTPVEMEFAGILQDQDEYNQILIFTDMMGGSVNQACFSLIAANPKIHVVAGMNLPLVLSLALQASAGPLDKMAISFAVEEARNQLIYVNEALSQSQADEEDE